MQRSRSVIITPGSITPPSRPWLQRHCLVRFDRPVGQSISQPACLSRATRHLPVNTPDKCICREEAHRPRQEPVYSARQQTVAEEEDPRDEALDVELREVVPRAVQEDPDGTSSPDEEGLPPPMIVLFRSAFSFIQRNSYGSPLRTAAGRWLRWSPQ